MDERERLVIRYAHLGSGRNPRNREILEKNRQVAQRHIEEIWAKQEQKHDECRARMDCRSATAA